MPTTTDDNRIDKKVDAGHGAYLNDAENVAADAAQAQQDAFEREFGGENYKKDGISGDLSGGAKNAEENPIKYTGSGNPGSKAAGGVKMFFKKKGGIIGIVSILGLGGIGVGIFGPGSLLIALTQNLTSTNDSSSRVMNRRAPGVLGRLTKDPGDDGGICSSAKKTIKCRGSKISNKALKNLKKSGIIAGTGTGKNFKPVEIGKLGYPKGGNPTSYQIDLGDGKGPRTIPAENLKGFLTANPKAGAKVFGLKGILNMKARAWAGKHIKKKFYKVFNLKKDGGLADGKNKKFNTAKEKLTAAKEKFKSKIPGIDKINSLNETISKKVGGKIKGAGKGGVAYTVAYATCLASKAPMIISAGVAGVQLARILPAVNELILSPGGKLQMSGIDQENAVTPEDIDTVSSILTDKTLDKDGNMTSALDSPLFLAAAGINKNKISPDIYGKYIPGYDILNNPMMGGLRQIQKDMAPACSVVMNPITMYAALAVESLMTKTNPVGLIVGFIASAAVSWVAGPFVEEVLKDLGSQAIEALAGADFFPTLDGIELGHALGASALAFFPAGAMARYIPALSTNQLAAAATAEQEDIARERAMDLASLSPFDISSKYTFLGSIVHTMRTAALARGSYNGGVASIVGNIINVPQSLLSNNVFAADGLTSSQCDNADSFDLTPEPGQPKPAINPVGLPCTDLTSTMSFEEAENVLIDKGWLDATKENVPEGATIDDLVSLEVIKKDTPMRELTEGNAEADSGAGASACSDASTGDYLFEMSGCVLKQVTGGKTYGTVSNCAEADISKCTNGTEDEEGTIKQETEAQGTETDDTQAYEAMRVWLIDYQIAQSINGEDDEEEESNSGNDLVGDKSPPLPRGPYSANTYWKCNPRRNHGAIDFPAPGGTPIYAVADGTVVSSGPNSDWGNYVRIQHAGGLMTGYAHMIEMPMVNVGDTVKAGQQIGKVGSTGYSTGNHLHFELYENGTDDYAQRADGEVVFAWLKKYNILPQDQDSINDEGDFCG